MGAEELQAMDAEAHERLKDVKINDKVGKGRCKVENQGQCWWPGCERPAKSIGLCQYHFSSHSYGTLLRIDKQAFPLDEIVELYQDVLAFADEVGIETNHAVSVLIAEGLNSYERRIKEGGKHE